jgi:hypothetical protein
MGSVLVSSRSGVRSGRLAQGGSRYRLGTHLTTIGRVVGFRCQTVTTCNLERMRTIIQIVNAGDAVAFM